MKIFFKIIALAIMIIGFYGSKADKLPFILKHIDGEYVRAKEGIKTLSSEKAILLPNDKGFKEITDFIKTKLTPKNLAKTAIFEKLQKGIGGIKFSAGKAAKPFVQLEVYIRDNPAIKLDLQTLEKELEEKLNRKILRVSIVIFWCGIILSLMIFFTDLKLKN